MARRALVPGPRLPDLLPVAQAALHYDVRKGSQRCQIETEVEVEMLSMFCQKEISPIVHRQCCSMACLLTL